MKPELIDEIPKFLEILGLDEEPMGIFYTNTEPAAGFAPNPSELPTRQREVRNEIDWQEVFGHFSCVMGNYLHIYLNLLLNPLKNKLIY